MLKCCVNFCFYIHFYLMLALMSCGGLCWCIFELQACGGKWCSEEFVLSRPLSEQTCLILIDRDVVSSAVHMYSREMKAAVGLFFFCVCLCLHYYSVPVRMCVLPESSVCILLLLPGTAIVMFFVASAVNVLSHSIAWDWDGGCGCFLLFCSTLEWN